MRIAVFTKNTTLHKSYGGVETQNKTLCEGLVKNGIEITVFSPAKDITNLNQTLNNVNYIFIPARIRLLSFLQKNSWEKKSLEEFIKHHSQKKYDLVISQSSAGLGIIRNKKKLGVKVISICHGSILSEYITVILNLKLKQIPIFISNTGFTIFNLITRQQEFIRGADKVITVSNYVKNAIVRETLVNKDKVLVIHNGIEESTLSVEHKNSEQSDKVHIIYCGRLDASKGVDLAIHAVSNISNSILNIVGSGDQLELLKQLTQKYKCANRVFFYGSLPHDKAMEMYYNSDIFILPTKRVEGFPMTIPEAMLASLPVVATNMGGISDAVIDGKTGYLVRYKNLKEITNKLKVLCDDSNLRLQKGKNARIKAINEFTSNSMISSYINVINNLVGTK